MIDKKLVMQKLGTGEMSLVDLCEEKSHGGALLTELQNIFFVLDESGDQNAMQQFNCFGFAWDRLPSDSRFSIIAIGHRIQPEKFGGIKFDDSVRWADFSLAQQTILYALAGDLLVMSMTLFSDQLYAREFKTGFLSAVREKAEKAAAEMAEQMLAVAA